MSFFKKGALPVLVRTTAQDVQLVFFYLTKHVDLLVRMVIMEKRPRKHVTNAISNAQPAPINLMIHALHVIAQEDLS